MNARVLRACLSALGLVTSACVLDSSEDVGTVSEAVATDPHVTYDWVQGAPYQNIGSTQNSVCFLTRVTGKFEGPGEAVRVYEDNGSWILGGASQQRDVAASARCVRNLTPQDYSPDFVWVRGAPAVRMAPQSAACFLTSVQGKLGGAGESIRIDARDGYWYLSGTSASNQTLRASARCFTAAHEKTGSATWVQRDCVRWTTFYTRTGSTRVCVEYAGGENQYFPYATTDRDACFLTGLGGHFDGGAEAVGTAKDVSWVLWGSSRREAVWGSAACIR